MAIDGKRIRELRLENNMTMEELGKACGVQRSAVNKWEKGTVQKIPFETMTKLCRVLRTSPAYLLGLDELTIENIKEQIKASKDSGIPIYKMGMNPYQSETFIDWQIEKHLVSKNTLDNFIEYMYRLTKEREITDDERTTLARTYERLENEFNNTLHHYKLNDTPSLDSIKKGPSCSPSMTIEDTDVSILDKSVYDEQLPEGIHFKLNTDRYNKMKELSSLIHDLSDENLSELTTYAKILKTKQGGD